jgi:alpha-tubulin suppressor-like RCC1 family protein
VKFLATFVLLLTVVSCGEESSAPADLRIEVVSGADQVSAASFVQPEPVVIRVIDRSGKPVANAEVHWRVIEGGGTISEDVTRTDAQGRASVVWTLGPVTGLQLLMATSGLGSVSIPARGRFEIIALSAGYRHTCAVSTAGTIFCWGLGEQGQLGNAAPTSSVTPVAVASSVVFRDVTAGWSHTCGISTSGAAYCWGDNRVGQLGITGTLSGYAIPMPVRFADSFTDISAGFVHTCGVTASGNVLCWGVNARRQLSGTDQNSGRITQQFRRVAAGEFHTCALRTDSVAVCWGWNSAGELGTNAPLGATIPTPAAVAGQLKYADIASGPRHSCATNGRVDCWGLNGSGELGYDPFVNPTTPAPVTSSVSFTDVGIGNAHTCAIATNRSVYCWGAALFNGTSADTKVPTGPVGGAGRSYRVLSVGYEHTCAITLEGEVWCWGSNSHGQLGVTGISSSMTPVRVPLSGS